MSAERTIWIVDDSESDHALLRLAFKDSLDEVEFESFYSAEEAVESLKEGRSPSLVLLDLNMPGLGGLHFLQERQERSYLHVPVVILSSSSNPDDIKMTYGLGANSYLEKPGAFRDLKDFASSVAAYWFKWAHLPSAVR